MAKALERSSGDIFYLGPIKLKASAACVRIVARAIKALSGKSYDCEHNPWLAKKYGKIFTRQLKNNDYDFIFAPAASTELAFVETSTPIVYLSDTTFANMIDYYPAFTGLLGISKTHGSAIERAAIRKSSLLLYPTTWAMRSAVEEFGAPREKTHVVAFGANFDEVPPASEVITKTKGNVCRLLFLGADWERKGGRIAFDTLRELNKRNLKSEMTVCGCTPPASIRDDNLKIIPYLNKSSAKDKERLLELFMNSHFLLLPTRAECAGIVFCEASAFGLPSITTNTGGVSGIVTDEINGCLLPPSAGAKEYADRIAKIYLNDTRYEQMVRSSRAEFDQKLNWDVWATYVDRLVRRMLAEKVPPNCLGKHNGKDQRGYIYGNSRATSAPPVNG